MGAQVGNPLQCYRSAKEGTTALRAALAVVEHNQPGFESHRQQPDWPRLTAQAHAALLQLTALAAFWCRLSQCTDVPSRRHRRPYPRAWINIHEETGPLLGVGACRDCHQ